MIFETVAKGLLAFSVCDQTTFMSQNPNALPATVASSLAPSSSTAASPHTSATRQPRGRKIYRSLPAGTPVEPTVSGARSAGKSRGGTRPSNTPPANPPPHGGSGVHGDSDDDVPSGASRAVASGAGGSRVVNDLALASQAIISVIEQNFDRESMPRGTWPYIKVDGSTKPEPLFFITDLKDWPSFYDVKPNPKAVEALCGLSMSVWKLRSWFVHMVIEFITRRPTRMVRFTASSGS